MDSDVGRGAFVRDEARLDVLARAWVALIGVPDRDDLIDVVHRVRNLPRGGKLADLVRCLNTVLAPRRSLRFGGHPFGLRGQHYCGLASE